MTIDLSNKRALVCGASKGIGRAIAEAMAQHGAQVTLLARSKDILEKIVSKLNASSDAGSDSRHSYLAVDMGEENVVNIVEKHVEKHGDFHIVVNNTAGPLAGNLVDSSVESLTQAFHNHILISHQLMRQLGKGMKDAGWGRFINIISTSVKQPIAGLGVSNVVRGAMASWSKSLATELAPFGITVNNVLPGATLTDRLSDIISRKAQRTGQSEDDVAAEMLAEIPVGRFATPQEIANVVLFLASEHGSYITGTSVLVDGGRFRGLS